MIYRTGRGRETSLLLLRLREWRFIWHSPTGMVGSRFRLQQEKTEREGVCACVCVSGGER